MPDELDLDMYPMARAVRSAYRAGQDDEAMEPLVRVDAGARPIGRIQDGDYVIFYDIRGEREVELTQAFVSPEFPPFRREDMTVHFVTMIEYAKDLNVRVAYPPDEEVQDTLSDVLDRAGKRFLKISESEKSIHVSFFFNGKKNTHYPTEERIVIPSPKIVDYTQTPAMSSVEVADATIAAMASGKYDLIVTNLANLDVLGHIPNAEAAKQAVTAVDAAAGRIVEGALASGTTVCLTADHGTVERWFYPDGTIDTGHTNNPVPFILIDPALQGVAVRNGELADVAPTVLQLLGLPVPETMSGHSLIVDPIPSEPRRMLILVVDGWGLRDDSWGNLILEADTPNMDRFTATYPHSRLQSSGEAVGLPPGTVGNSEAGHSHIGAGRRLYSDRLRIEEELKSGQFQRNPEFLWAMRQARDQGRRLHLLGIISFFSSHGSVEHLKALLRMAQEERVPEVYIHGLLGRRGERPESGAIYVADVERTTEELELGTFAGVIGRFWALDREHNWDRIQKTYRWLVYGEGTPVRG